MTPQEAAKLADKMVGSFPSPNIHNPKFYVTSIIEVLSEYPLSVGERAIKHVIDTLKWIPARAEVKAICDELAAPPAKTYGEEWDERSREQLAAREQQALLEPPKQTFEEVRAEMAARGVFFSGSGDITHGETPATVRKKLNLSEEQWDAIPNSPPSSYWRGVRG